MSSSSEGRARMESLIPEALRAVLTTTQQFLLMDTVLVVSVGDLRRAMCDAEFAEQLVQRPPSATGRTRFQPRPASEAELAVVAERTLAQEQEAMREEQMERLRNHIRLQANADIERVRQLRQNQAAAAVERRREAGEVRRQQQADLQQAREAARLAQQASERQAAANRGRRPPNQSRGNTAGTNFAAAIQNIAQSSPHRPGHVPVLGGQAAAREETLAQARANRLDIDWNSTTRWRRSRSPRAMPAVPIASMAVEALKHEVENAVAHVARIFQLYAADEHVWRVQSDQSVLVQAQRWLAIQPAFRALVQEAVRRGVFFNTATTSYITEFVLGASSNAQLADFVNHPVRIVTEESVVDTFGRSGRALRLDDD